MCDLTRKSGSDRGYELKHSSLAIHRCITCASCVCHRTSSRLGLGGTINCHPGLGESLYASLTRVLLLSCVFVRARNLRHQIVAEQLAPSTPAAGSGQAYDSAVSAGSLGLQLVEGLAVLAAVPAIITARKLWRAVF